MHVRDMLRIMGAGPALRTLAQLERMAGRDRGERGDQDGRRRGQNGDHGTGTGRSSPANGHEHEGADGDTWRGVDAWSGDAVSGDVSDLPGLSTSDLESAAYDTTYGSGDPRENTTGTGQFASDDFAWMMAEERRGESSGQEGCAS